MLILLLAIMELCNLGISCVHFVIKKWMVLLGIWTLEFGISKNVGKPNIGYFARLI